MDSPKTSFRTTTSMNNAFYAPRACFENTPFRPAHPRTERQTFSKGALSVPNSINSIYGGSTSATGLRPGRWPKEGRTERSELGAKRLPRPKDVKERATYTSV